MEIAAKEVGQGRKTGLPTPTHHTRNNLRITGRHGQVYGGNYG